MSLFHNSDFLDDYDPWDSIMDCYDVCPNDKCVGSGQMFKGQKQCDACEEYETELSYYEQDNHGTKAERREARREKQKHGPVRHLEGDFRPAKFPVRSIKRNPKTEW